jgi:hypothetical protein
MSTCNFTQSIPASQCIGDSLVTINSNFNSLDTNVCTLQKNYNDLLSFTSMLSTYAVYTQVESVIGSTETINGFIGKTTLARGTGFFPPSNSFLADFNWQKANGTSEVVRMELVNPASYAPWQNFFPYKPAGKLKHTKMTIQQPVMDNSGSIECMFFTFFVDWSTNIAVLNGTYQFSNDFVIQKQFVFNKRWNFATTPEIAIATDSNTVGAVFNTLGERNAVIDQGVSSGNTTGAPLIARITSSGIEKIPVWSYPGFAETSNVAIFIENTFNI